MGHYTQPPSSSPLLLLLLLFVLLTNGHAQSSGGDVCGDGTCGSTENIYWCSRDCGGTCGDNTCSRDESYDTCADCACSVGSETEEEKLGRLINEYRQSVGLATIPIGVHMTTVARAHARDTAVSSDTIPSFGERCNLHSWSSNTFDGLRFSSCCYTSDHAQAQCMWDKPKELTPLTGEGFEISAVGYESVEAALDGWKKSPGHNSVIVNLGTWNSVTFTSMGVGVDTREKVYHVWFYREGDDIPKPADCKGSVPGGPGQTQSPQPTAATSPPPPSPPPTTCESDTTLRLSVVERTKSDTGVTVYTERIVLWEGETATDVSNPTTLITVPGIPTSLMKSKKSKVMLRFALCGKKRKLVLRYYREDEADSRRRAKKTIREDKGSTAYDDLEKTVKKVFGKKQSKKKWAAAYMRMNVWIDKGDGQTQTMSFRLDGTN